MTPGTTTPRAWPREWEAATAGAAYSLSQRAAFDVALTVASMRLLSSLHEGRIDPRLVGFDYDVSAKRLDLAATLRSTRDAGGLRAAIAAVEPRFPVYRRLVKALADYRALVTAGEPAPVPTLGAKKKVAPGQPWAGVTALVGRPRGFGDLPPDARAPETASDGVPLYAGALVDALKRFQGRHALEPDGVIGPGTIEALNVPAATRVRQIELALERERWLPETRQEPHVFVNVPLFRLWAYDPGQPDERRHREVARTQDADLHRPDGVRDLPPLLESTPEHRPRRDRAEGAAGPRLPRTPGDGDRGERRRGRAPLPATPENLDMVASGRLFVRQKPGEKNSLGLAKFIFPNSENVPMHGTPAQSLFARARRVISHGCIRLEDPARLAEWVLRDNPEWTRERIDAAMKGERPTQVNLKQELTVFLFYDTAYVDSKGAVYFADDYYGHDARLERALRHGYPYPRKS